MIECSRRDGFLYMKTKQPEHQENIWFCLIVLLFIACFLLYVGNGVIEGILQRFDEMQSGTDTNPYQYMDQEESFLFYEPQIIIDI